MRGTVIANCFKVIQLMKTPGGITVAGLARELNVTTRTAYRYLMAASVELPIWQTRRYPKRYKLLEETDFEHTG